ncbi:MAG TPA: hypothetical protein VMH39_16410 [Gemmatimonadaceae bacterium]|nr:hypothetical protein [Gemmatimonadaceae bacterium]
MHEQNRSADARASREARLEKLAQSRKKSPLMAVVGRFLDIDGATQSGLVSLQLFSTVIPLIIIGFGYLSGFAANASVGDLLIRQFGLLPPLTDRVRDAFGPASAFQSRWTFIGVAGFLAMGIPMSVTVSGMFARAWRRSQFKMVEKLARGALWFALFLGTLIARERIGFGGQHGAAIHAALLVVALLPQWAFWSLTPWLLVRNGGRGWRYLLLAGLAGVVIDGVVLELAARAFFPVLLKGWTGFGPIGVAMMLMTWCGVVATAWVIIACVGAILWERSAPARIVVEVQVAAPEPVAATPVGDEASSEEKA